VNQISIAGEIIQLLGFVNYKRINWKVLLFHSDCRIVITCLDIILEHEDFNDIHLLARLLSHRDEIVRLKSLRSIWYFFLNSGTTQRERTLQILLVIL
jgi:hypothetical protein